MKVLLLRPYVDSTIGVSPPMALLYLSGYLKSKSVDCRVVDHCVERKKFGEIKPDNKYMSDIIRDIESFSPDIIGMTLFSKELSDVLVLCQVLKIRFPNIRILLGGPHPTVMPAETLEQIPFCDFVIRGEGELAMYDLINTLSSGGNLSEVRGLSYRNSDKIVHNEAGAIVMELDSMPLPDRDAVLDNYRQGRYNSLFGSPCDILLTSRGCPFRCRFCFKVCDRYRGRSAEAVLDEIDTIVKLVNPRYIQIMDDSFTIQRERTENILKGIIARGYHKKIKWKVRSRVTAVDASLLGLMKKAGVVTVVYGFESGSQTMLDAFDKRTKVEDNIKACRMTREAGLTCLGDMILFYPGETNETLKETQAFVRDARPTAVQFYVLTPLPGTKIYQDALESGKMVGSWNVGDQMPWVKLEGFGGLDEMMKIARKMMLRNFFTPGRVLWLLRTYGLAMLANPDLYMIMISNIMFRKRKY